VIFGGARRAARRPVPDALPAGHRRRRVIARPFGEGVARVQVVPPHSQLLPGTRWRLIAEPCISPAGDAAARRACNSE
jgi:hypothetical protein